MIRYIKTELIENFLKENNLSKTAFCKNCKVAYSTFMKLMYGNADNCNILSVFRIAKYINIQPYELFSCKNKTSRTS